VEGAGTFIAKTRHGHAILVNTIGKASGDPCSFNGTHLYDVGVTDWMGATYCWNNQGNPWVYCNVSRNCNPWTPGAGCDYFYQTFPYETIGRIRGPFIEMTEITLFSSRWIIALAVVVVIVVGVVVLVLLLRRD